MNDRFALISPSAHPSSVDLDPATPDISICVAVHTHHPSPNLASLAASLPAALGDLRGELIVALNGVSDAGVPDAATTVAFAVNRGVPVAWNAAARLARAPMLCVVNDDVVLGKDSLALLHQAIRDQPAAGVAGPVGTRWDIARARHLSYLDLDGLAPGVVRECEVISGFLLMTPTEVFNKVGGFEEAYTPCGFEEVDYCTAVRLVASRRCLAVAGVKFTHEFGVSSKRPWFRIRYDGRSERIGAISRRNRRHFLSKWSAFEAAAPAARHQPSGRP